MRRLLTLFAALVALSSFVVGCAEKPAPPPPEEQLQKVRDQMQKNMANMQKNVQTRPGQGPMQRTMPAAPGGAGK